MSESENAVLWYSKVQKYLCSSGWERKIWQNTTHDELTCYVSSAPHTLRTTCLHWITFAVMEKRKMLEKNQWNPLQKELCTHQKGNQMLKQKNAWVT